MPLPIIVIAGKALLAAAPVIAKAASRTKIKPSSLRSVSKTTKKIKVKPSSVKSATKTASKAKIKPNTVKSVTKSKIKDSARKAIEKTKDHYTSKETYINMFKIGNSPREILKAKRRFETLTEGIDAIIEGDEKKALKFLKKLAFSMGQETAFEFAGALVQAFKENDFPEAGTIEIENLIKTNESKINAYLKKKRK